MGLYTIYIRMREYMLISPPEKTNLKRGSIVKKRRRKVLGCDAQMGWDWLELQSVEVLWVFGKLVT